jgi:adenosylhomocysteinase
MNIDFIPFQEAWGHQAMTEVPFLWNFTKRMEKEKLYKDLKILHNIPLSLETVCKLESLFKAGAKVTVTVNNLAQPATQSQAIDILTRAGISVVFEHKKVSGEYDFCLDCGAEFIDIITPKKGIVELTRSGALVYADRKLNVPVVSVDDSKIKNLETYFGTSEAFLRAFLMLTNEDIKKKKFIIFGFGKVGKGIVNVLKPHTDNIVVIDISQQALDDANNIGVKAYNLTKERQAVEKEIVDSFAVLAATGIKHVISKNFNNKEIFRNKYLANIGIDEFGALFEDGDILYDKKWPINFSLPNPTQMRYLDPSFYAHNIAIEIIISRKLKAGYYTLPADIDDQILARWQEYHKEEVPDFLK